MICNHRLPAPTDKTYFDSGRSALQFIIQELVRPRVLYLPSLVCIDLIDRLKFVTNDIQLRFYRVHEDLSCAYPRVRHGEALLRIHYFGAVDESLVRLHGGTLIDDISHCLHSYPHQENAIVFGSLRKLYPVADGGFVVGFHNPRYATADRPVHEAFAAQDWHEWQSIEAWFQSSGQVLDMTSQSMAIVAGFDVRTDTIARRKNWSRLSEMDVGYCPVSYKSDEVPIAHVRILESAELRDELRAWLIERNIYTAILWPLPVPLLSEGSEDAGVTFANRSLAFPVDARYGDADMEYVVAMVNDFASRHCHSDR